MEQSLAALAAAVGGVGVVGYILVFLVTTAESLAFVGALVPGAIVTLIFGGLAAQGIFDPILITLAAALGAIFGDTLSFYFGKHGKNFFTTEKRFFNISHVERGKRFFLKYGKRSVIVGRFVGPLRPIVPFVAGLSHMETKEFMKMNIFSGILWAVIHISVGYFFVGVISSYEIWSKRIGLSIVVLIVVAFMLYTGRKLYLERKKLLQ